MDRSDSQWIEPPYHQHILNTVHQLMLSFNCLNFVEITTQKRLTTENYQINVPLKKCRENLHSNTRSVYHTKSAQAKTTTHTADTNTNVHSLTDAHLHH